MTTRWETFPVELKGGRNEILPSIQQGIKAPGSSIFITNFEPSLKGGYRRINGYSKFSNSVVPSTDDTTQLLGVGFLDGTIVVPRETSIYSSTGAGWTEIDSSRTASTKHRYHTINYDGTRKLIGVDGVNYPYEYDGTTLTDITGTTDIEGASQVVDFKNHTFYAKDDLVVFTAPFTLDDFNTGNGAGSIRMPDRVTGFLVFRERLFVFTESQIKVVDGSSVTDFAVSSVSESVGCLKEDTIQEVAGDVMFLSSDGLRLLGATDRIGDFSNENASKTIQSLVTSFVEKYDSFCSVIIREKSQYRILGFNSDSAMSTEGWLGTQFEEANPNSMEWSQTLGIKAYASCSVIYQGEEFIYFVSDDEYVYRMDVSATFDGTAIKSEFRTPFISFNDPTVRKTVYSVKTFIEAEGRVEGELKLNFNQDANTKVQPSAIPIQTTGGQTWGNFNWNQGFYSGGSKETSVRTTTVGSGFSVSLEYKFETIQDPFILDTVYIQFAQEDRK